MIQIIKMLLDGKKTYLSIAGLFIYVVLRSQGLIESNPEVEQSLLGLIFLFTRLGIAKAEASNKALAEMAKALLETTPKEGQKW